MKLEDELRQDRELLPIITDAVAALGEIPEQDRQRLSRASRLKLDAAEAKLRGAVKRAMSD